jgi:hypothetical protein
MPTSTDNELQARLLKEIYELDHRKRKLEDAIRNLEAVHNSLQETAALRDIEAYKNRPLRHERRYNSRVTSRSSRGPV